MMRRVRRGILAATLLAAAIALAAPVASFAGARAHTAKHHKKHHKKKHHKGKPTTGGGPSMTVVGFGMNHLYVANGTTVSSTADCSTMVDGNGYLDGPPQNIYIEVYIKASDIPASSPTQIGEDDPVSEDEAPRIASVTLDPAVPWSQAFSPSTLGFGTPPGSQADIFRGSIIGENDANGPSASDFNGTYTYEVSVDADGTTLDSTATVTIDCPYG
jgi:hypothetical protein